MPTGEGAAGRLPLAVPAFRPRFPWLGGDLQTLRNHLLRPRIDLAPWPGRRLLLPLDDGSGDRLAAELHWPQSPGGPSVVLIHGLTGCQDSAYIRASARALLSRGHAVVRLNLRGAGPSRPTCRGHYHAGRSEDLAAALAALERQAPAFAAPGIVPVGYSLGGNVLIKHLAERGACAPVVGAVAVSAPLDLRAAQLCLMRPRNAAYHGYLVARMKEEAVVPPAQLSAAERQSIAAARSVRDFDHGFVAPRHGFTSAEDYYARASAQRFLPGVAVPTLVIHALDDPWIPPEAFRTFDWTCNTALTPLIAPHGGHVGFHGADRTTAWHDGCVLAFLAMFSRHAFPIAGPARLT